MIKVLKPRKVDIEKGQGQMGGYFFLAEWGALVVLIFWLNGEPGGRGEENI
jgi:hypothetical protein